MWTLTDSLYNPFLCSERYDSSAWQDCWSVITNRLRLASLKLRLILPFLNYWPQGHVEKADGWILRLRPLFTVNSVPNLEIFWTIMCDSPVSAPQQKALTAFERKVVAKMDNNGNGVKSHMECGSGR